MTVVNGSKHPLRVAIIGGGPAGLAAAIELSKLPFVEWTLYEKKPEISETGGGISMQRNTWRMLEAMDVAKNISAKDFFRPYDGHYVQHRNARTGILLSIQYPPKDTPPHQAHCRMLRAKLQNALLKGVDQSRIRVSSRLVDIKEQPNGRLTLSFEDGLVDEVDLLVGADGIRSFVRQFAFPDHSIKYVGQSAYRTIVKGSDVEEINGIPRGVIFWHNLNGKYVYTCPLGGDDFEVTARIRRPAEGQDQVSWGQECDFAKLLPEYEEFCPPLRQILGLASKSRTGEFALFAGPRLETVVSHGSIALIGDASHPLSGAFGAGAGFAFEDVHALTRALQWARSRDKPFTRALELFDSIRSPHYKNLYDVISGFGESDKAIKELGLPIDDEIAERVQRTLDAGKNWMYFYKVEDVVSEALRKAEEEAA